MHPYCLFGIVFATAYVFIVLYWWSEGAIEASEGILLATVFGGLVIGLFAARNLGQFLLAFVPLSAAGAYGLYTWKLGSWRTYYRKRCADYEAAIRSDPRNLAAREFLADALYGLGDLDRATDEMQAAVDLGAGMECQYKLGKWSKERYLRDTTNPVCRWCETENRTGDRKCMKCGADLPYDSAFTRWLMGGRSSSARYYLLAVSAAAVVCVSWLLLPAKFALVPFAFCVLALAGWSLVSSARS